MRAARWAVGAVLAMALAATPIADAAERIPVTVQVEDGPVAPRRPAVPDGGPLPRTGADATGLTRDALVLIAGGALLVRTARRRGRTTP